MEFSEKLKNLRKNMNITQEELAEKIYVSRTAVSKWESGKGYPSIESLKILSEFFNISIDELLTTEEVIKLEKNKNSNFISLFIGIIDIITVLLLFLPLYGYNNGTEIVAVPLINLTNVNSLILAFHYVFIAILFVLGVATIVINNFNKVNVVKILSYSGIIISVLFIVYLFLTKVPYAGIFVFILLCLKGFLLIKNK